MTPRSKPPSGQAIENRFHEIALPILSLKRAALLGGSRSGFSAMPTVLKMKKYVTTSPTAVPTSVI
jgi:hypothetical protein